jgi:uncharacterized RDD family membrane protein YckC
MNLASWIQRVGAFLVDALPSIVLGIIASFNMSVDPLTKQPVYGTLYWICQVLSLAIWLYNRVFQQGKTGQSWGKKALGLKLLAEQTGQPIGAGKAFLRDVAHILDSICFIGYLFPLWDAKKQTFADKIVKTVVVK